VLGSYHRSPSPIIICAADYIPDADDYVVTKLRDAGVVITGKTATPEFGLPC
jgi:Asp-tRNA(Asn)/Glu-tRNA(Gln) amidotransferase A subunit family amidase